MPWPSHFSWFYHPHNSRWEVQIMKLLILYWPVTWSLLDPNYLLKTLFLISSLIEFWFVRVVAKYLNSSTLSKELFSIFMLWLHPACWS
jgi:hypothetical protein